MNMICKRYEMFLCIVASLCKMLAAFTVRLLNDRAPKIAENVQHNMEKKTTLSLEKGPGSVLRPQRYPRLYPWNYGYPCSPKNSGTDILGALTMGHNSTTISLSNYSYQHGYPHRYRIDINGYLWKKHGYFRGCIKIYDQRQLDSEVY